MTNKIGIIGAGISGLTLGCVLAKDSQNCTIYEKSDGPSTVSYTHLTLPTKRIV